MKYDLIKIILPVNKNVIFLESIPYSFSATQKTITVSLAVTLFKVDVSIKVSKTVCLISLYMVL